MTIFKGRPPQNLAYKTDYGMMFHGASNELLSRHHIVNKYAGKVQLIFTSPPFPLNTKKKYGNLQGEEYIQWFVNFGPLLKQMLTSDGSIVIELGNSWEPGKPVMSTLALRTLLRFQEENNLHLCQEFICHNPARLPSPAQWVNIERIRVKDSFTRLWWLSSTENPKADNKRVLIEYSPAMKSLLRHKRYNAGKRPSEHNIGEKSFLKDHGGAIPPNVLGETILEDLLSISNTKSHGEYIRYCKSLGLQLHPARMQEELAAFFISFLTDEGDIVLDPFAGSNTTGAAAEELKRNWISVEMDQNYIRGSVGRFKKYTEYNL